MRVTGEPIPACRLYEPRRSSTAGLCSMKVEHISCLQRELLASPHHVSFHHLTKLALPASMRGGAHEHVPADCAVIRKDAARM